jgi:hypothetical protein
MNLFVIYEERLGLFLYLKFDWIGMIEVSGMEPNCLQFQDSRP